MNACEKTTLTVGEVRRILKIGTNTAYTLIHSNSFPVRKVGHSYRIPSESFFRWLGGQEHTYNPAGISGADTKAAVKY